MTETETKESGWGLLIKVVVAVIGVIGLVLAAWISKSPENRNSNQNVAVLQLKVVSPANGGSVSAFRKKKGNEAYFPVTVSQEGRLPSKPPDPVTVILLKQGDAWWIQEYKDAGIGLTEIEAWSGGGEDNDPKIGDPLKLRAALVSKAVLTAILKSTNKLSGENATELQTKVFSESVDFSINEIGPRRNSE